MHLRSEEAGTGSSQESVVKSQESTSAPLAPRLSPPARRIGIFGGTFDPVHIGHLILAEEACFHLQLDCVYFVPAADPPHKRGRAITPAAHRIRMLELAIHGVAHFAISRIDVDRPGPHYTVDTVRLLYQEQEHSQQRGEIALYFLMGMDSLRDLPTWYQPQWLVANCNLVALSRHDVEIDWQRLESALPGVKERVTILDMPELEIASHTLQERVRKGWPIRYQVPQPVEAYIMEHRLYQSNVERRA